MLLNFLSEFQPTHADQAMTATRGKESPFSRLVGFLVLSR